MSDGRRVDKTESDFYNKAIQLLLYSRMHNRGRGDNMAINKNEIRMNPQSAIELYHLFLGKPQCSPIDSSYVSDKHVHKETELVYVSRGEVEVMIDQKLYTVHEGEILNICGYALHQYQQKKVEADIAKVKFLDEWLLLPFLDTEEKNAIGELYGRIFIAHTDEPLKRLLHDMLHCPFQTYDAFDCYGKICQMTAYLLAHPELVQMGEKAEISGHRYMEQAIAYMQDHCTEKLTLKMLADHLGLTETYCSKYIKKNTGITFVEYLNVLRVNRAQRLLLVTDFGISEISELVGFSSVQTFNRVFKQQTGKLSPSEYRKRKQNKKSK